MSSNVVSQMITRSTKKTSNKGKTTHKVQIDPLINEGFELSDIRKAAKKMGFKLVDTDTKLSIESNELSASLNTLLTTLSGLKAA